MKTFLTAMWRNIKTPTAAVLAICFMLFLIERQLAAIRFEAVLANNVLGYDDHMRDLVRSRGDGRFAKAVAEQTKFYEAINSIDSIESAISSIQTDVSSIQTDTDTISTDVGSIEFDANEIMDMTADIKFTTDMISHDVGSIDLEIKTGPVDVRIVR